MRFIPARFNPPQYKCFGEVIVGLSRDYRRSARELVIKLFRINGGDTEQSPRVAVVVVV